MNSPHFRVDDGVKPLLSASRKTMMIAVWNLSSRITVSIFWCCVSSDYLFKFLIIGRAGSGKSCLLHHFIENKCRYSSTIPFCNSRRHECVDCVNLLTVPLGGKCRVVGDNGSGWPRTHSRRSSSLMRSFVEVGTYLMCIIDLLVCGLLFTALVGGTWNRFSNTYYVVCFAGMC